MAPAPGYIGCAGWSLPLPAQAAFGAGSSHLQRYATRLNACEINSSFHRPHSQLTYRRWADSVPETFRFSVKLPKTITHERKLLACEALLDQLLDEASGLGPRLGCLLVQLPPSLAFDPGPAGDFLHALRTRWPGAVAAEPRHGSWFGEQAEALLSQHGVARVLADPVRHEPGAWPGGWPGLVYLRLHGSPRMYYSAYGAPVIGDLARRIVLALRQGTAVWCIFDNTAGSAAVDNALGLQEAIHKELA
jgi:uncharacterized protein YecE (DUF72 family)